MQKKNDTTDDVISLATRCETAATECGEALAHLAQTFTHAAEALRKMHALLGEIDCKHLITFKVTKEMHDRAIDQRTPGKYCVTCGIQLDKPQRTDEERAT